MMKFNLNKFINACKSELPNYLKYLVDSGLKKQEISRDKRLIILFLRDYLKYNEKNKFTRNQFSLEFIDKFFREILPRDYSEFFQISEMDLPGRLKKYIEYLTLRNILQRELSQKIIRALDKNRISNQIHHVHLNSIEPFDDDFENYSEEIQEEIFKKCDMWMMEFTQTDYFQKLTPEEKDHSAFLVESFFNYLYGYCLKTPEQLDVPSLEEICLDILPRKVSADESYYKAIAPILTNFFKFLEEKGVLHNAEALNKKLNVMAKKIVKIAADPRNWGPAKSFAMDAIRMGVDLENQEELDQYIAFYNLFQAKRELGKSENYNEMVSSPHKKKSKSK